MKICREIFPIDLYGLRIRTVGIADASFIVQLRSNSDLCKYMVVIDNNIEKQCRWIEKYKMRELAGSDYYFVYELNDERIALSRLSHINHKKFTCRVSSIVKRPDVKGFTPQICLAFFVIAFDILKVKLLTAEIHQMNKSMQKYWDCFDIEKEILNDDFYIYKLSMIAFNKIRGSYIELFEK